MIRCLSLNAQRQLPNVSLLNQVDMSDRDILFLQRCHVSLAMSIRRTFNLHIEWKASTNISANIGMCILSKKHLNVETKDINVNIDHADSNQCSKYQIFDYDGFKFVNFLPPYEPAGADIEYLTELFKDNFDFAIGDTHTGFTTDSENKKSIMPMLPNRYTVVNNHDNFMSLHGPMMLTWAIIDKAKLKLTDEKVHLFDQTKHIQHFPVSFNLETL